MTLSISSEPIGSFVKQSVGVFDSYRSKFVGGRPAAVTFWQAFKSQSKHAAAPRTPG